MITIVDCGIGNLQSVQRAFERVGAAARISSNPSELAEAEKLVLPGVGAFSDAMGLIGKSGLREVLDRKALEEKTPVLGICLGFQLMTRQSEEGCVEGLGWLNAETKRFSSVEPGSDIRIPSLGWSNLNIRKKSPLFQGLKPEACFYFAHSYFVAANDEDCIAATACHGVEYVAAAQKGNLFGVQFHPEKSHAAGLAVIENFVRFDGGTSNV